MSASRETAQLSLLGDPPKVGRPWRPTFYQWRFCGVPVPLDDDAVRQVQMLTRETQPDAFALSSAPAGRTPE